MAYSMAPGYAIPSFRKSSESVTMRTLLLLLLACALVAPAPADAMRPRDREQDSAFRETQQGRFLPLRAIEARIVPKMRGFVYLGPELYPDPGIYRLKFMRGARVIWLDFDARTGELVGRSGF